MAYENGYSIYDYCGGLTEKARNNHCLFSQLECAINKIDWDKIEQESQLSEKSHIELCAASKKAMELTGLTLEQLASLCVKYVLDENMLWASAPEQKEETDMFRKGLQSFARNTYLALSCIFERNILC